MKNQKNNSGKVFLKAFVDTLVIVGSAALVFPRAIISFIKSFSKMGTKSLERVKRVRLNSPSVFFGRLVSGFYTYILKLVGLISSRISKPNAFHLKPRGRGRPRKSNWGTFLRKTFPFLGGVVFGVAFFLIPWTVYSWYRDLPRPEILSENIVKCTKILDRKHRLLYEICPLERSDPITLNQVPKDMINATLAIEDSEFYKHGGFRVLSILRALKETTLNQNLQGGSTITQQLVKLSLLSPERTIARKINELVLSILVERTYSKDQILEMYLNFAPYGGNVVGIESASQKYFGKNTWELDLAEESILAGLPTAPSVYSPFVNIQAAKMRQRLVLDRMVELKYISKESAEEAFNEELIFSPQKDFIRAPHFVDFVRLELEKMYGKRYANYGGLTVVTTLDLDIQDAAQKIISEEVEKSKYLNISNGASIVLSAKTGEILSMVGSKDYFDTKNDGVFNVAISERQPGSSIKAVTYSLAILKGYRASTVVDDSPTTIRSPYGSYTPVNYDGKYHGKVSVRAALANSYNVAAVNVLRSLNIDDMVVLGKKMGLTTWEADGNYGLSITLGGRETRLIDLTNVYGTLSRGGVFVPTTPFMEIKDSKGNVILKESVAEERAIPEEVAYIITNILSDRIARLPAFGVNNFLSILGHTVAVKTGTTDLKRDNYTVGYTPSYVVGVWVGNNDNRPMNPNLASGLSGAAPAWNKIMSFLIKDTQNEQFPLPPNIVFKTFSECGNVKEVYVKGTEPKSLSCKKESEKDKKDKEKKKDEGR